MELAKYIVYLLVGLVTFVTGMNLMSKGLKDSAGVGIRKLFKKIKNNLIVSSAIGAGVTAIIQSSGATTVMVVGFLSAGALTFAQGYSLMLGAFLGTTITGLLVSLSSFSFSIFLMALAFIGFVLGFFKSERIKSIGEILVGFGILFFGLEAMKSAFNYEVIQSFIVSILTTVNFPLLVMLIGMTLTIISQSSSATNGIVIVMVMANPSLLSSGVYLVIGSTIGALFPTFLAALKGNALGKQVTYSTIICRFLMALITTLIIWAFNVPLFNWLGSFPKENVGLILAIVTVIYNLIYLIVMLPFTPLIEKIAPKIFKDKLSAKKRSNLKYINDNLLTTPSVAIIQVQKEIMAMYDLSLENYVSAFNVMMNLDFSKEKEITDKEETIDYLNYEISEYLIKLSAKANIDDEAKIGGYYHVINDIERIGDHASNFLDMARKMHNEDLMFSYTAKEEFARFKKVVDEMFIIAKELFLNSDPSLLMKLHDLEEETDKLKEELENNHYKRIINNECNNALTPFHSSLTSELERIADHLTNIGYSNINPTGDMELHNKKG